MSASDYLFGTDVLLGAGEQYLVIRVKNVGDLVAKQGGAVGKLAHTLAPQTITDKVYDEMRKEMLKEFAKQGADVDIQVTATPPMGKRAPTEFGRGALVGGVGAAVLGGLALVVWRILSSRAGSGFSYSTRG